MLYKSLSNCEADPKTRFNHKEIGRLLGSQYILLHFLMLLKTISAYR